MKVKLTLNIGTADQKRLGLTNALADSVVAVADASAKELVKRGWGVIVPEEAPAPKPVSPTTAPSSTPKKSAAVQQRRQAPPVASASAGDSD